MRKRKPSLMRRTYSAYRHQVERAAEGSKRPTYTLKMLRRWVQAALDIGACPYCARPLTVANFALDHATPVSRGGRWSLSNLVVCDRRCNEIKGSLTAEEYRELLNHLTDCHTAEGAEDVLRRLRAGGRIRRG